MSTPPPDNGDQHHGGATPPPYPASEPSQQHPDAAPEQPREQGSWQQNAYQQGAYQNQPQGQYQYAPSRPNNTMALISMISGIAGLTIVPLIGSIVALITGRSARKEIARTGEGGSGLATAGIIMGWIGVGIGILVLLFVIAAFVLAFSATNASAM